MNSPSRKERIENALWGLFIGDSLAMPAHWIYQTENIAKTFGKDIEGFEDAPHPHPESFMVGMGYQPNVTIAKELNRPFDILHEHARFYKTSYSELEIQAKEREGAHGNSVPSKEERYHYHHGLKAGENTVAAHLVRVLMRSVAELGRYDEKHFLDCFVQFMSDPSGRKDPYTEIYLRRWFENYSIGVAPESCAELQREVWSIGSHGGMIRPMVVSLLAESEYLGLGFGIAHQQLTHRSENVTAALGVGIPLLHDLISGKEAEDAAANRSQGLKTPKLNGHELHQLYSSHRGPGNIPDRQMWKLHTELSEETFDLKNFIEQWEVEGAVLGKFATACYPEHGLPLLLYLAAKHRFDVKSSLLANVNSGGDNVHRGAVLGLVLGAASNSSDELASLSSNLVDHEELKSEIKAFATIACKGYAW